MTSALREKRVAAAIDLPADELVGLEALGLASRSLPRAVCGVYFLWRSKALIYVGKSTNVVCRLLGHHKGGFDSYTVIECPEDELTDLETAYILLFKPPLNGKPNEYPTAMKELFPPKNQAEWRAHYRGKPPQE